MKWEHLFKHLPVSFILVVILSLFISKITIWGRAYKWLFPNTDNTCRNYERDFCNETTCKRIHVHNLCMKPQTNFNNWFDTWLQSNDHASSLLDVSTNIYHVIIIITGWKQWTYWIHFFANNDMMIVTNQQNTRE